MLDRARQGEGIGRDDAHGALEVDERLGVERLGVDDGRVDVGEDLEFVRAADVVAVAGRAVGDHPPPVDLLHLAGLEWLDHSLLGHAADPPVGLDAHLGAAQVFCTTMFGNFDVMSFCSSAIFTAQRRAMRR